MIVSRLGDWGILPGGSHIIGQGAWVRQSASRERAALCVPRRAAAAPGPGSPCSDRYAGKDEPRLALYWHRERNRMASADDPAGPAVRAIAGASTDGCR